MTNKKHDAPASREAAQQAEPANRRSFIKTLAAGSVAAGAMAAGTVAGTKLNATASQDREAANYLTVRPRPQAATLRLSFNRKRQPDLDDVFRALERALGETGCTKCGLGGIDVLLRLDEIINPVSNLPVAVLEGELPGI